MNGKGSDIRFTKMHGLGNDYIYLLCTDGEPECPESLAVEMSDRHTGVGADGIILIMPGSKADFRMRMFNADGSEGRMCGNASRCIAKYVYDRGLTTKRVITLETLAGVKTLMIDETIDGKVASVTVDMGTPELDCTKIPVIATESPMISAPVETSRGTLELTAVSMGNPHGVIFIPTLDGFDITDIGPELERHPMWPERANIEFAEVISPTCIRMRVWERGSGETMACGTGACATAVAAATKGLTERTVTVKLRGGDLRIEWRPDDGHVYMTGPATTVFEGIYHRKEPATSEA